MLRKVALLVAASWSCAAWAGDKPVYAPVPDWVKPAPAPDLSKAEADAPIFLLLDRQTRLKPGELWTYMDSATRIPSEQLLGEMGTVKLPWDPDKGDLIIHRAAILRGTETIDLLAGDKRFSVLRREMGLEQRKLDGELTATMAVEGLRVGDVLRLSFSITRADAALKGEVQADGPLLADPVRVGFGRIRILWPETLKLSWKSPGYGVPPKEQSAGGWREVNLAMPVRKPVEMPKDAPLRFHRPPMIEATSYADWPAVSRGMAPLYATTGAIADGSPLAAEVATIAKASPDPRVRAAMALRLVQDKVRYLFNGMAGGNYVPQKPADTWSMRYGDCKAKTLMLLAMLHALGIEAEPVLVNSQAGDMVPERLPMPGAFDHVIVRATIGGESLWLDGTQGGTRLADLSDTPPFRHVLPLRTAGAPLMPLPMRASVRPDAAVEIDYDASAGINLPTPFTLKLTLRGQTAEALKGVEGQLGKEKLAEFTDQMAGRFLNEPMVHTRSLKSDEEAGTAVISVAGLAYPAWERENGRYRLSLDGGIVEGLQFEPDRTLHIWSDIPVATSGPGHLHSVTRMRLGAADQGFTFEGDQTLPASLAGTTLSRRATLSGGLVTVDNTMVSTAAEIAPANLAAERRQVTLAKSRLLKLTAPAAHAHRWQQVLAAKGTKTFEPIIAAYGKRIAADPRESVGYTDRAWFLESIYDYAGALKDIDSAITIKRSADLLLKRSALNSTLGQLDKALADARAAHALDPGSDEALSTLASLMGEKGDVAGALLLVEERIAAAGVKERGGFMALKADILADAGRVEEALATLDAAVSASPGNPELLNNRCWLKGTHNVALDTALRDCTKAIELGDNPAPALDSRAMVYFRMNRMEDALADLDAALEAVPDLGASLYLRGLIRKRAGNAAGDADLAGARMIAPRTDARYAAWGIRP